MDQNKTELNETEQRKDFVDIIYKGSVIDELQAINLLKDGEKPSEFNYMTTLMLFSAVNYQKDGWKSVPDAMRWGKRLAKIAVAKDYKAIKVIPEQFRTACVYEFAQSELMQSRKTIKEWVKTFIEMDDDFIKKVVKSRPSLNKYIPKEKDGLKTSLTIANEKKKPLHITTEKAPDEFKFIRVDEVLGGEADPVMSGDSFLALAYNEKTEELLNKIIASKNILPDNFIKELILPNRNAYFYQKKGDTARYEQEKKNILPYINKGKCLLIARTHPEAAIETPQFLDKGHVKIFWARIKDISPKYLQSYFLKFPKETLDIDMLKDIDININVINHVPELFETGEGHEMLIKYLDKHSTAVLYLPEQFQYLKYILKDGVILDARTIRHIKNKELRKKVRIALKIR